jgi:predicted dehydrogenase
MTASATSAAPVGVGIIGCGVIAGAYLEAAKRFPQIRVVALADRDPAAAEARGQAFGIPAVAVDALLADPAVEIVLNLTIPVAHVPVGLAAIAAGKHVYAEKPLAVSVVEGRRLVEAAATAGLRLGSAPDTFLGGSHQTARALVDQGRIGQVFGGTAFLMLAGHERWHPSPDFYYVRDGGGPVMDMAPYYLTDLVQLIGPVAEVTARGTVCRQPRTIATGPRTGQAVPVDCLTHLAGTLVFESGAIVQLAMSFEVWGHKHTPIELYGSAGSMLVPDPNRFDGTVMCLAPGGEWQAMPMTHGYGDGNHRILGLVDMAVAIREGRPHRASGDLALHVLEIMAGLIEAAESGGTVRVTSRPKRPAPFAPNLAAGEIA